MAGGTGGRRSSHGIDRAVLEAGMGSVGAVLEALAPAAGGGRQDERYAAPVPSQKQPRAAWEKERFWRWRTDDQAVGGGRTAMELRAGSGAAVGEPGGA